MSNPFGAAAGFGFGAQPPAQPPVAFGSPARPAFGGAAALSPAATFGGFGAPSPGGFGAAAAASPALRFGSFGGASPSPAAAAQGAKGANPFSAVFGAQPSAPASPPAFSGFGVPAGGRGAGGFGAAAAVAPSFAFGQATGGAPQTGPPAVAPAQLNASAAPFQPGGGGGRMPRAGSSRALHDASGADPSEAAARAAAVAATPTFAGMMERATGGGDAGRGAAALRGRAATPRGRLPIARGARAAALAAGAGEPGAGRGRGAARGAAALAAARDRGGRLARGGRAARGARGGARGDGMPDTVVEEEDDDDDGDAFGGDDAASRLQQAAPVFASARAAAPQLAPAAQAPAAFFSGRGLSPPGELTAEQKAAANAKRAQRFNTGNAATTSPDPPSHTPSFSPPPAFIGGPSGSARRGSSSALPAAAAPTDEGDDEEYVPDLEGGRAIVGTCVEMCPPVERERRAREGELDPFERVDKQKNVTTPALAVKKFTRSTDNPVPSLFRTPAALRASMMHLLGILRAHGRADFKAAYGFVWDRFRAIRTDITVQRLRDPLAIWLYECMARFHIFAAHQLCDDAQSATNTEGFNAHLNIEQLTKCLTSLFSMYAAAAQDGTPAASEPEFRAYYLLLLLDAHGRFKPDMKAVADELRKLRPEVARSPPLLRYFRAECAYHSGNWVAFFRAASAATHMEACLLHLFFGHARRKALRVAAAAHGRGALLPLSSLAHQTATDAAELAALAEHHGLALEAGPAPGTEVWLRPREASFVDPGEDFPPSRSPLVLQKEPADLADCIAGPGAAPPPAAADALREAAAAERATSVAAASEARRAADARAKAAADRAAREKAVADEAAARAAAEASRQAEADRLRAAIAAKEEAARARAAEAEAQRAAAERAAAAAAKADEEARAAAAAAAAEQAAAAAANAARAAAEAARLAEERRLAEIAAAKARAAAAAAAEASRRQEEAARAEAARRAAEVAAAAAAAAKAARQAASCAAAVLRLHLRRWRAAAAFSAAVKRAPPPRQTPRKQAQPRRWPALDLPRLAAPLLARAAPPGAPLLTWKLVARSGASGDGPCAGAASACDAAAAAWLRDALQRGAVAPELAAAGVLSLYVAPAFDDGGADSYDTQQSPEAASVVPRCLIIARDVAPGDAAARRDAAAGASAALFLVMRDAPPEEEAAALSAMLASLPPRTGLPLLLLAPADAASPADEAAAQALAVQLRVAEAVAAANGAVGDWQVLVAPPDAASAAPVATAVLQLSVMHLAVRTAPQPALCRTTLRDVAEAALAAAVRCAAAAPPMQPPSAAACVAAANAALETAADTASEAHAAARDAAWPPPEAPPALELPPPAWSAPGSGAAAASGICAARLPPFTPFAPLAASGEAAADALAAYIRRLAGSGGDDVAAGGQAALLLRGAGTPPGWPACLAPLLLGRAGATSSAQAYLPPPALLAARCEAAARGALQACAASEAAEAGEVLRAPHAKRKPEAPPGDGDDARREALRQRQAQPLQPEPEAMPQSETERAWALAAAAVRAEADAAARHDAWLATAATLPPGALRSLQPALAEPAAAAPDASALGGAVAASPAMTALREARRAEREASERVGWQLRAALGV